MLCDVYVFILCVKFHKPSQCMFIIQFYPTCVLNTVGHVHSWAAVNWVSLWHHSLIRWFHLQSKFLIMPFHEFASGERRGLQLLLEVDSQTQICTYSSSNVLLGVPLQTVVLQSWLNRVQL